MNFALIPVFLALGVFVGFLAGLLGIGGGFTIVPVLVEVFTHEGVRTEHLLPLAIGTSAATIIFTAFASTRAHHKRGAVAWPIVWAMAVPALSMATPARAAARCSASRAARSPGVRTAVSRWRATRRIASWA